MKTALLISTYNWVEALELVLESVLQQTQLPDEILIADDGSKTETKECIAAFSKKINRPVKHFWQEDNGFRKSKILNKAIAGSIADYIIQVDGDCILHRHFVSDHLAHKQQNTYLYGSRVNIKEGFVNQVLTKKIIQFNYFSKQIKNKTRTLHIPFFSNLYKAHEGISKKFRGCNVSYWRADFIAINGYNEDFEGWGKEDSDLAVRLGNLGVKAKRLRYAGIVFHIWHRIKSKENVAKNTAMEEDAANQKMVKCEHGVSQYL